MQERPGPDKVEGGSLATRLWLAPPTKMDAHQLMEEGYYNIYGRAGARTEMPGCSLCMGKLPTVAEYMEYANKIDAMSKDIYRYLNFDRLPEYTAKAAKAKIQVAQT